MNRNKRYKPERRQTDELLLKNADRRKAADRRCDGFEVHSFEVSADEYSSFIDDVLPDGQKILKQKQS